MNDAHPSASKPDVSVIWALINGGLLGSGLGVGVLILSDTPAALIFGSLITALGGVLLSIGMVGAGVYVGIQAAKGGAAAAQVTPTEVATATPTATQPLQ